MQKRTIIISLLGVFLVIFIFGIFIFNKEVFGRRDHDNEDNNKEDKRPKMFRIIPNMGSYRIDQHLICREVINTTNKEIMIPTKTKDEWCSFVLNYPKGVILKECYQCTRTTSCANSYASCTRWNYNQCQ